MISENTDAGITDTAANFLQEIADREQTPPNRAFDPAYNAEGKERNLERWITENLNRWDNRISRSVRSYLRTTKTNIQNHVVATMAYDDRGSVPGTIMVGERMATMRTTSSQCTTITPMPSQSIR